MSRVDVMVTSYNYARYLRQSVESVLTQSHRDVRVIIVDDASTDETPALCAALAREDDRVESVRHQTNRGHIATYNECIALAQADYLLILSADDFLLPGALARAVSVLDRFPEVGFAPGVWVRYKDGDPVPDAARLPPNGLLLHSGWFIERLALHNFIATATAIVRTTTQKRIGGYHPELPHTADLEMWIRFALHSRVAYVQAPQAAYRQHEDNMSAGIGPAENLDQCTKAVLPHYDGIRRLPGGAMIETRIRRNFAHWEKRMKLRAGEQNEAGETRLRPPRTGSSPLR